MLCNDVALNPGPSSLSCPKCSRTSKKGQAHAICNLCSRSFHLKCLGPDFDENRTCFLCSTTSIQSGEGEDSSLRQPTVPFESDLMNSLKIIGKTHGMTFVHQNVCSLLGKIDELRATFAASGNVINILTISETWLSESIADSEISIPGYLLFRKDRATHGGGVAVYVRNDLSVIRRFDLELLTIESLWLEIFLPNSRGLFMFCLSAPKFFNLS